MLLFIIFYINFMFIFISSFQVFILIFLYVLSFYITLYSIFSQQMLLLFILLVLDGKTNYYLFIYIIYHYTAERFREHLRSPSPIYDHYKTTGHEVSLDNFSIVGRDDQSMTRLIREAMLIRINDPSLNRNIGKYQLPHIWDEVLVRSPEMHLK